MDQTISQFYNMNTLHLGSHEFNDEQLNKIINLILNVCFSSTNKFNDSPLKILARLGYEFIKMELISRISDGFNCRTDENIKLYYDSYLRLLKKD